MSNPKSPDPKTLTALNTLLRFGLITGLLGVWGVQGLALRVLQGRGCSGFREH